MFDDAFVCMCDASRDESNVINLCVCEEDTPAEHLKDLLVQISNGAPIQHHRKKEFIMQHSTIEFVRMIYMSCQTTT